jgi:hypothetical protein
VLAVVHATGFPAVLVVAGTVAGIIGIVLCVRDRSEVGTKWVGAGLGLLAVGILIAGLS